MFKPFEYQSPLDRILNKPASTGLPDFSTGYKPYSLPNPVGMTRFQPIGLNTIPPVVNTSLNNLVSGCHLQDQTVQDVAQLQSNLFGVNQQLMGEMLTKRLGQIDGRNQEADDINSILSNLSFQPKHF